MGVLNTMTKRDYWIVKKHGDIIVQYNKELNQFGWDRLSKIAQQARSCELWDGPGVHKADTGNLDGIVYIAFPVTHPSGKILVCIETQEGFEKVLGVKLSELAEYNLVSDGQHKHGVVRQINVPPVKKFILEKRKKE